MRRWRMIRTLIGSSILSGCATVPLEELTPSIAGCWQLQPGPWESDPAGDGAVRTSQAPARFRLGGEPVPPVSVGLGNASLVVFSAVLLGDSTSSFLPKFWMQVGKGSTIMIGTTEITLSLKGRASAPETLILDVEVGGSDEGDVSAKRYSRKAIAKRIACP